MRISCTRCCLLPLFFALFAAPVAAKDDSLDFLHVMQREGFADLAIDYLNELKSDPNNAPPEIMASWDLEMSRSLGEAARQKLGYNDDENRKWADDSKALLDKYIKANPGRPEAIMEAARLSEEDAAAAQFEVERASGVADPAEKARLLAEARKLLVEVRPRFADAEKAARDVLVHIPAKPPSTKRNDAVISYGEKRLNVAMIDFYAAQTQPNGDLDQPRKEFESIYSDFADGADLRKAFVACRAHFYSGRIYQLQGKFKDAKDAYEEVLVLDPHSGIQEPDDTQPPAGDAKQTSSPGGRGQNAKKAETEPDFLDIFFAEVERYYLQVLYQLDPAKYVKEINTWRLSHKATAERTAGYQGLMLDFVRHLVAGSKQNPGYIKTAQKLLEEMKGIPSPYMEEAMKLGSELDPNGSSGKGFLGAVFDGDAAAGKKKWDEAIKLYEKALALADAAKSDPAASPTKVSEESVRSVKNKLAFCYYNKAGELFNQKKVGEAIEVAYTALSPKADLMATDAAPSLAAAMMAMLDTQYRTAPSSTDDEKKKKAEILARLRGVAHAIIKSWPAREEADDAGVMLMHLAREEGNLAEAGKYLNGLRTESKAYAAAMNEIGYSHWVKYLEAKKLIEDNEAKHIETDKATIAMRDKERLDAQEYIEKAVAKLDKPNPAGGQMPDALRIAKMMLAEIYSEAGDKDSYAKAAALYRPLIEDIKSSKKPLDDNALRILDGAGRAWLQVGDVQNIVALGEQFVNLAPDDEQSNLTIVRFAKQVDDERKRALEASQSAATADQEAAAAKVSALTDSVVKMMVDVSKRKKLPPTVMVWLAMNLANLGTDDSQTAAADLIVKIFDLANSDAKFEREIKQSEGALHALGATILAKQGQYQKAKDQIDAIIQQDKKSLEPRVSEAKILTEWASKDPSKYREAITKWDGLRESLQQQTQSDPAKMDPQYDVVWSEAQCYLRMAQNANKINNKADADIYAKKGFDLLQPYFDFDANIRAPNDLYREMSAHYYQLAGKLAGALGTQAPKPPKAKPSSK